MSVQDSRWETSRPVAHGPGGEARYLTCTNRLLTDHVLHITRRHLVVPVRGSRPINSLARLITVLIQSTR